MIQKRFENRATRRNNKKKKNKRFVNLMAISTVTAVIFAYSINGVADNKKVSNKVAVELGVEKIEKDKVKIKLDNFTPVINIPVALYKLHQLTILNSGFPEIFKRFILNLAYYA